MNFAGRDGTRAFDEVGHSRAAIAKREEFYIGDLGDSGSKLPLSLILILVILGAAFAYTQFT